MSVASRRLWWAALVICAVTLAGIVIGELTIDLPRVRSRLNMVIGPTGAAVWMVAGLISWRVRPDSKVGPLMVLIGWLHPAEPLIGGLAGAHVQWVLFIRRADPTLILLMALSFPGGRLTRAGARQPWGSPGRPGSSERSRRCSTALGALPGVPGQPAPVRRPGAQRRDLRGPRPVRIVAVWTVTAVILIASLALGERAGAASAGARCCGACCSTRSSP